MVISSHAKNMNLFFKIECLSGGAVIHNKGFLPHRSVLFRICIRPSANIIRVQSKIPATNRFTKSGNQRSSDEAHRCPGEGAMPKIERLPFWQSHQSEASVERRTAGEFTKGSKGRKRKEKICTCRLKSCKIVHLKRHLWTLRIGSVLLRHCWLSFVMCQLSPQWKQTKATAL